MMSLSAQHNRSGFTLIELIITLIIIGFAAVIITPYLTAVTHGPDPVLREKAIALGQAMMDEILAKRWDENSPNGGGPICTSESRTPGTRPSITVTCDFDAWTGTLASAIGLDGEIGGANNRNLWDDVDDYHGASEPLGGPFYDQNGNTLPGTWTGFSRSVAVDYIASKEGDINTSAAISAGTTAANATDTKRIIVTVTSPLGETFQLVAVACNF